MAALFRQVALSTIAAGTTRRLDVTFYGFTLAQFAVGTGPVDALAVWLGDVVEGDPHFYWSRAQLDPTQRPAGSMAPVVTGFHGKVAQSRLWYRMAYSVVPPSAYLLLHLHPDAVPTVPPITVGAKP